MAAVKNQYVDNKKLYTAMVKHINAYRAAIEAGEEPPKVSNYIGKCIQDIAQGLSLNRKFIRYSFREDMKSDGIYTCLLYLHNFDPDKYNNPFAYFTQIMFFSFLQRIDKEKKQSYIKYKAMEQAVVMNSTYDMAPDDHMHFQTVLSEMDYDKLKTLADRFENPTGEKKPKQPKKKKGVETFLPDE